MANRDLARRVMEYTQIDISKFEESIIALTQESIFQVAAGAFAFDMAYYTMLNDVNYKNFNFIDYIEILYLVTHDPTNARAAAYPIRPDEEDLFSSIENEKMPIKELPNPLIVSSTFDKILTKSIQIDPEGIHTINDAREFIFWDKYQEMNHPVAEELMTYYKRKTNSLFAQNLSISAVEHIRSNTCDIPCLAYHGNMKYTRYDSGIEDIKCIGHLGNSFPGVANVRDGRGVIPANNLSNVFANH
jgi:hypothetical protein